MTTAKRHRNPWPVAAVPAAEVEIGDRIVVDGFDYQVAGKVRDGLPLGPDGGGVQVEFRLAHPCERRGRPRSFAPPVVRAFFDQKVERVAGPAAWVGL